MSKKYISDSGVEEKANSFLDWHIVIVCGLISISLVVLGVLAITM